MASDLLTKLLQLESKVENLLKHREEVISINNSLKQQVESEWSLKKENSKFDNTTILSKIAEAISKEGVEKENIDSILATYIQELDECIEFIKGGFDKS